MARNSLPDRGYVSERLIYSPDTGLFHWRERHPTATLHGRMLNTWNSAWAGQVAGTPHSHGYVSIIIDYGKYRAHRLAWLLVYGEPVPDMLDHIDGNPANNRIANLRPASMSENIANARTRYNTRSGVKGVRLHACGKYDARITVHGKHHYLGLFATLEEAAAARRDAAHRLHGAFARHD
jgi:hypothetical protein